MLSDQGMDVVVCSISMYDEVRDWNRENIENYHEIYIKPAWETLLQRNQKGLYSGKEKNVVGVDLPYDEPKHPDIVIQNDGRETPEEIVTHLEHFFGLSETTGVRSYVMVG
jgi:adenylylsulfate kinase